MVLGQLISATPRTVSNLRVEPACLPPPHTLQCLLSEESLLVISCSNLHLLILSTHHSPPYYLYISISLVPWPLLGDVNTKQAETVLFLLSCSVPGIQKILKRTNDSCRRHGWSVVTSIQLNTCVHVGWVARTTRRPASPRTEMLCLTDGRLQLAWSCW